MESSSPSRQRLSLVQRRQHARAVAMGLLGGGMSCDEITLRAIASEAGWPLASLHHAYSTIGSLLTDCLVEVERSLSSDMSDCVDDRGLAVELQAMLTMQIENYLCVPAREQMLRYQFALASRGQQARVELSGGLWAPRGEDDIARWLSRVMRAAGESYILPFETLVKAIQYGRDGAFLSYFNLGDLAMLRAELEQFAIIISAAAHPGGSGPDLGGAGTGQAEVDPELA